MGHLVALGFHAHLLQHLDDALLTTAAFLPSRGTEDEVEIVVYIAVNEQLKILKDNADALAKSGNLTATDMTHVITQHLGLSAVNVKLGVHGFQQTGLARAYRTDKIDKLALPNLEIDVLQNDGFLLMDIDGMIADKGHIGKSDLQIVN